VVVRLCPKLDRKLARHAEKMPVRSELLGPMARPADYCIMGWDDGEKLKEGELRTTRQDW
jgi:hypothetical protein